jgi:hypothetical protein
VLPRRSDLIIHLLNLHQWCHLRHTCCSSCHRRPWLHTTPLQVSVSLMDHREPRQHGARPSAAWLVAWQVTLAWGMAERASGLIHAATHPPPGHGGFLTWESAFLTSKGQVARPVKPKARALCLVCCVLSNDATRSSADFRGWGGGELWHHTATWCSPTQGLCTTRAAS